MSIPQADGGATFSAAIPVVTGDVRPSGLEYSAWDMAVGRGGRVHVAMATNAPGDPSGC